MKGITDTHVPDGCIDTVHAPRLPHLDVAGFLVVGRQHSPAGMMYNHHARRGGGNTRALKNVVRLEYLADNEESTTSLRLINPTLSV